MDTVPMVTPNLITPQCARRASRIIDSSESSVIRLFLFGFHEALARREEE